MRYLYRGCFSFFHSIHPAEFPGVRLYHSSSRDTLSVTQISFQVSLPSHEINRIIVIIFFNSFSDFFSNPHQFPFLSSPIRLQFTSLPSSFTLIFISNSPQSYQHKSVNFLTEYRLSLNHYCFTSPLDSISSPDRIPKIAFSNPFSNSILNFQ